MLLPSFFWFMSRTKLPRPFFSTKLCIKRIGKKQKKTKTASRNSKRGRMPFDPSYAKKAATILLAKGKALNTDSLLSNEDSFISCQVALMKFPVRDNGFEWRSPKQYPLRLVHPIHVGAQVCVITNEDSEENKSMVKGLFRSKELKRFAVKVKVLPIQILKRDYAAFEAKRKLCGSYDLFLADDRIIPLLPSRLGKCFFAAQKQPLGLQLYKTTPDAIVHNLNRILSSTWITFGHGVVLSIRVGRFNFTAQQIAENCESALSKLAEKPFIGGWKGFQTCVLAAAGVQGIALPIYRRLPVYVGPSKETSSEADENSSESDSSPKPPASTTADKKKGAKVTATKTAATPTKKSKQDTQSEEPASLPKKKLATKPAAATPTNKKQTKPEESAPEPEVVPKKGKSNSVVAPVPTPKKVAATSTTTKSNKRSNPEPEPEPETEPVAVPKKKSSEPSIKVQKTATKAAASSTTKAAASSTTKAKTLDTPKKVKSTSSGLARSKSTGSLPGKKITSSKRS